jgi:WD40 repeat protein
MALLAVSFCNTQSEDSRILAVVDADSGEHRWLDYGRKGFTNACGLAQTDTLLYSACSNEHASYLAVFEKPELHLREIMPLNGVFDAHSICLDGDAMIVASSGSDEIVRLTLDGSWAGNEVIWRASDRREDTEHVNALMWHQGRLLCSGFGGKVTARWSDSKNGYVYDVTKGSYLVRGISHPHSLGEHRREVYFCESSLSSVRTMDRNVAQFSGYVRGLAFSNDGKCFVGRSIGRYETESPEFVLNPMGPGVSSGTCAIEVCDSLEPNATRRSLDLTDFAREIYDILLLR